LAEFRRGSFQRPNKVKYGGQAPICRGADPQTAYLKMVYIDLKVPGGLGGAYVWAVKDDDADGTMVKTMAAGLGLSR